MGGGGQNDMFAPPPPPPPQYFHWGEATAPQDRRLWRCDVVNYNDKPQKQHQRAVADLGGGAAGARPL